MLGNMPTVDAGQFQWLIWAFGGAFTAITSGIIWLYKDNKEDRKAYSMKLESIIESSNKSKELNTLALQGLISAVDELRKDLREDRINKMK